jgi:putative GTP pyrophosphokinase
MDRPNQADPAIPDKKTLEERYASRAERFNTVLIELERMVQTVLYRLPIHATVKGRVKTFESYFRKILKKLREKTFKGRLPSVSDIIGIRVICPFLEDLNSAEQVLRDAFEVVRVERKGVERSVREFGYESTHLLVRVPAAVLAPAGLDERLLCEIQLQTILQEAWSEVEHELVYKADISPYDETVKRKLAALNAMLALSDIIFQEIRDHQGQLNEMLKIRRESFSDSVKTAIAETSLDNFSQKLMGELMSSMDVERKELGSLGIKDYKVDELLVEALAAHNERRFELAVELYSKVLDIVRDGPIRAVILVHRGMARFARHRYREALGDFSLAMESDESFAKALYCRGVVHSVSREYREALADFNRCLELDPFHFDSLYGRAHVYYMLGNYAEALANCDKALSIDPSSKQAQAFREVVRTQSGL